MKKECPFCFKKKRNVEYPSYFMMLEHPGMPELDVCLKCYILETFLICSTALLCLPLLLFDTALNLFRKKKDEI
jgi:hypothetical protein